MNVEDCYSELGVRADCTDAEVKAAWRRLARQWHPDRNASPLALHKIQRINQALDEIRKVRSQAVTEQEAEAEQTLDHTVTLTLEEAAAGCIRDLQGELVEHCRSCTGSGVQAHVSHCTECGGTGRLRQPLWLAWHAAFTDCTACGGSGKVRQPCPTCNGSGKAEGRRYRRRVRIPAGVRHGDLLHVPAQVQAADGRTVSLSARVEIEPHPFFHLDADGSVHCEVPVDGFAWTANRWIEVPTLAGLQQMRLRRGSTSYRIRGMGFPVDRSGPRGDCMVSVVPLFPDELSKEQETLVDKLVAGNAKKDGVVGRKMAAWNKALDGWQKQRTAKK